MIRVYEVTREYGGPEEGGWWYDHYTLLEETRWDFLFERLCKKYKDHGDEWVIFSDRAYSRGGGILAKYPYIFINIGDENWETKEKPHYE